MADIAGYVATVGELRKFLNQFPTDFYVVPTADGTTIFIEDSHHKHSSHTMGRFMLWKDLSSENKE